MCVLSLLKEKNNVYSTSQKYVEKIMILLSESF